MKEFVGLRSKCYSILIQEPDGDKQKSTAAGVKMSVQKSLHHDIYKQTLEKENDFYITQNLLKSNKHVNYSITQTRVGLTAYDDKRYLLPDGVYTRAYGHYLNKQMSAITRSMNDIENLGSVMIHTVVIQHGVLF